ncbi:MAG: hypothetical protein QOI78_4091, partial [Actinomycetota bacterium]|nr:hypothetical protein [Actinomycetota bacterium]
PEDVPHESLRAVHPDGVTLAHCDPAAYTHVVSPVDPTRLAKPGELDPLRGECALPAVRLAMLRGFRAQLAAVQRFPGDRT